VRRRSWRRSRLFSDLSSKPLCSTTLCLVALTPNRPTDPPILGAAKSAKSSCRRRAVRTRSGAISVPPTRSPSYSGRAIERTAAMGEVPWLSRAFAPKHQQILAFQDQPKTSNGGGLGDRPAPRPQPCSVTRAIRCCHSSPRTPGRPSMTRPHSRIVYQRSQRTFGQPWPDTRRHGVRTPPRTDCRPGIPNNLI
jgi:hypothetical protein